jgi:hypothetical protein
MADDFAGGAFGTKQTTGSGSGSGDVTGPASSTNNAIVRFHETTGKIIQNSAVTIDDSGSITSTGTTILLDSSGTATYAIDRGATTNFSSMVWRTAGTDQWTAGLRNDSTNTWYLRDNINGVNALSVVQGAAPAITTGGALAVATNLSVGTSSVSDGKIRLLNSDSSAEYNIWNNPDPNIPYDSLWLQRVYSQSTIGDPYATLVVVRAPENSAVISAVDTGSDFVTTSANHLFNTGATVIVQNSGGAVPGGLTANTVYAVRALSVTTLAFFPTVADANANTNRIDLTDAGSGTNTIYLSTQEATMVFQRRRGDNNNEFMDVYANGYEDSVQFGIRIQKRGSAAALRPFIIDNYDGSTFNTLIYVDNVNNRIGLGGNVAPTVALDITGAVLASGSIITNGTEFGIDSAGTAVNFVDRGAITNFGLQVFRTAGTDQWIIGTINNSTNNLYIQDAVNGFSIITAVQGATPTVDAAGVWTFSSGILRVESVVAKTQAVSPYSVTAAESGRLFTNEGATASVTFSLPTAVAGLTYTFVVQDADGIIVDAATGDTIQVAASVSATSGNATSTTIGSSLTLTAINATEWVATSMLGSWVVT